MHITIFCSCIYVLCNGKKNTKTYVNDANHLQPIKAQKKKVIPPGVALTTNTHKVSLVFYKRITLKMSMGKLLILEGNICAGKTSLSRDLGKLLDYHVFFEPMVTNPYLEKFYAGMLLLL